MQKCNFGVIGAGYMGKAHSLALQVVGATFNTNLRPVPFMICTSTSEGAKQKAQELGFAHHTQDWRELVTHPKIDAVIIATPPLSHKEIALAAFASGKHVFCEKPMSPSFSDSQAMTEAAMESGKAHMLGYNYIRTPASQQARKMIQQGAIGSISYVRAEHTEDFLADPSTPFNWRCEHPANGCLRDLAPHIINASLALAGDISSLTAELQTVYRHRPSQDNPSQQKEVSNDDQGHLLCRFASGAIGSLFFSRTASGQKMGYKYEIYGSKGALKFDQEDQNSLWYFDNTRPKEIAGFTKILISSAHPDFAKLCPGDGHGTGYQEQIIIELRDFLKSIETGHEVWPSFKDGLKVEAIVQSIENSNRSKEWERVLEFQDSLL